MATIGILVCDRFPPETELVAGGSLADRYERFLGAAEPSLTFRRYDAIDGELPTSVDECDGWIITGSRADAHGDDPWVHALLDWIRDAAAERTRIVGVCFGHQAIAQALGGRVERADAWTVGPQMLALDETTWSDATVVHIHAMHRDVVTELPPGASLLGTGETAAVPAYRIGDRVLCVQDHPEFDDDLERHLIEGRRDRIGPARADDALARMADTPVDGTTVATMMVDFLLDRRRR